ncbi:MAG TPA: hypothetical protein VJ901_17750 [Thermoanaerobaculia bacterium]|nr:hypothetical protein [Thermoanaerobaculia bacterium]
MMMLSLLLVAAIGFSERPVAELQLVPAAVNPRIASNGRGSVGVWTEVRGGEAFLFSAAIDHAGNVVDSRPVAKVPSNSSVVIASDGDRYLAVQTYSQKGFLLDEHGGVIREIAAPDCRAIASNGSSYALVINGNAIQLVDTEGAPIGGRVSMPERIMGIAASGRAGYILLTDDGKHLLVRTYLHGILSAATTVGEYGFSGGDVAYPFSAAIASNGDEAIIVVSTWQRSDLLSFRDGVAGPPRRIADGYAYSDVIWTGSEFVVSILKDEGTALMHVSRDGAVLSSPVPIASHGGTLVWNGFRLLFADATTVRSYAASPAFPADGDAHPIAPYAAEQRRPRIATDGESLLVSWLEPFRGVYLADGAGINMELRDASQAAALAWDGKEWVIAYPSSDGLRVRTMTRDGVLSSPARFASSTGSALRIASRGDGHFVLVWAALNPSQNPDWGTIRVSLDGTPPFDITHGVESYPDITWDGGVFRLVWMNYEFRSTTSPGFGYYSATAPVGITFATMDSNGNVSMNGTTATTSDQRPRVARDFTAFVNDGVKVRRGGDEIALPTNLFSTEPPAFAVDDDGHALLVSTGGKAVFIGAGGDPIPFIAAPNANEPDVVWTRNGWVMVYSRIVDEAPYFHVPRVFVRTIDVSPARRRP